MRVLIMEANSGKYREIVVENNELKRALALAMNKGLIKKLIDALNRINSGEYVSEEEFFNRQKS